MQLIQSSKNKAPLDKLCKQALEECDEVLAAVAYVMDTKTLIQPCFDRKIPLKLWARHDYSLPVRPDILQQFLDWKSPNYTCKLVEGIFHPKIIWWKGYGIYIGSANLTDKAWFQNFESGVFLSEFDIEEQNFRDEIEDYFELIDGHSHALTQDLVKKIADYERNSEFKALQDSRWTAEKIELLPKLVSLTASDRERKKGDRQKNEFAREWNETLAHLQAIAKIVSQDKYRPDWFHANASPGVQADQFLHAFYYRQVMEGNTARHRAFHEQNKKNPEAARDKAMQWWKNTYKPSETGYSEKIMIDEWAPFLQKHLAKNRILNLSEPEVFSVLFKIHAFRNYAERNASNRDLGLSETVRHSAEERMQRLSEKVSREIAPNGKTFLEMLHDLLYGGPTGQLPDRLYEAAWNPEKRIPHFGIGSLGEIVGWALPDEMPPRNGRTSKALYALGYDVKLYSE